MRSMKYLLLLSIMVFVAGCGTSKEAEMQKEEVLRFNLGADPKSIEPAVDPSLDGIHIINNTFESLVRLNGKEAEPAMAESWDLSEDGSIYTFYLRDSKWSDGVPVKASDFEYAWKRVLDPAFGAVDVDRSFYIKGAKDFYEGNGSASDVGIEVIDDKTLRVELIGPIPYFLDIVSSFMPIRKDIAESAPEAWTKNPETAISNGPFKLTEYNLGENIILERNPYYWNAENVKLDKIVVDMIVEATTAFTAYENDELDIITDIPAQEIPRLMLEDTTFYVEPRIGTYYYIFNVQKAPFDDVRVRKALSLAINRRAIVDGVTKAGEIPATGFIPGSLTDSKGNNFRIKGGDYGIDTEVAKVDEARALLAEAGYPDGEGFPPVTLLYNTNETHKAVAEAAQAMWKENLNIDVDLMNQEWAVFQDRRHLGNFDIARGGYIGDYLDPAVLLELWTSDSGDNDAQWRWTDEPEKLKNNKEYDTLFAQSLTVTGEERDAILYKLEKILMDDMVVAPVYYYTGPVMVKDRVKGWEVTGLGHFYFGRASIEE